LQIPLKIRNFVSQYGAENQYASLHQISWRSDNTLLRYGDFPTFDVATIRHLGLLNIRHFNAMPRIKVRHLDTFLGNGSNHCKNTAIYGDF